MHIGPGYIAQPPGDQPLPLRGLLLPTATLSQGGAPPYPPPGDADFNPRFPDVIRGGLLPPTEYRTSLSSTQNPLRSNDSLCAWSDLHLDPGLTGRASPAPSSSAQPATLLGG